MLRRPDMLVKCPDTKFFPALSSQYSFYCWIWSLTCQILSSCARNRSGKCGDDCVSGEVRRRGGDGAVTGAPNERNRAQRPVPCLHGRDLYQLQGNPRATSACLEKRDTPGPPARAPLTPPAWRVEMLRHKEVIAPGYSPVFAATLTLNYLSRTVPQQTFES